MQVRICAEDRSGSYNFNCPSCRTQVSRNAEDRIIQLLLSGGVELEVWHLPAELFEPVDGPPITHDDVLDFHLKLEDDAWLAQKLSP